jgi:hypothetical protein
MFPIKKRKKLLAATSLLLLLLALILPTQQSCYYDNEEDLYGNTACDTVDMNYTADVLPILQANCYSCHRTGGSASIPMDSYLLLKDYVDGGQLLDRINNQSRPMPQDGLMKLCDRQKIEAWVKAGAKND